MNLEMYAACTLSGTGLSPVLNHLEPVIILNRLNMPKSNIIGALLLARKDASAEKTVSLFSESLIFIDYLMLQQLNNRMQLYKIKIA